MDSRGVCPWLQTLRVCTFSHKSKIEDSWNFLNRLSKLANNLHAQAHMHTHIHLKCLLKSGGKVGSWFFSTHQLRMTPATRTQLSLEHNPGTALQAHLGKPDKEPVQTFRLCQIWVSSQQGVPMVPNGAGLIGAIWLQLLLYTYIHIYTYIYIYIYIYIYMYVCLCV